MPNLGATAAKDNVSRKRTDRTPLCFKVKGER
jgi:hypothetical protein